MKLFFDARYIRTDFHDGISRYSTELAGAVYAQKPDTIFLIWHADQAKLLPANAEIMMFHSPASWREPFSALFLNKYHPDILFSPMQTIGTIGQKFKTILTVHDLIYYRHRTPPRGINPLLRIGWFLYHVSYIPQRLLLKGASIVATVSHTSKHDIENATLTNRPIIVVPNAPQKLAELVPSRPDSSLPPIHLIYMGSSMPYKNIETLVRGMAFLPDFQLHILSRIPAKRKKELKHLAGTSDIVFHNGVTDAEYAHLLTDRALLVSASVDEGYGLPLAESLALGVPVIVSDLAIFHEVAGEGALYFNPHSPADFAAKVTAAAQPEKYHRLSQAGKRHIAHFTWEQSAKEVIRACEQITTTGSSSR